MDPPGKFFFLNKQIRYQEPAQNKKKIYADLSILKKKFSQVQGQPGGMVLIK